MALAREGVGGARTGLGADEEVDGARFDGSDLCRVTGRRVARGEEEAEEGERRDGARAPLQRAQHHALHAPHGRLVEHELVIPLQPGAAQHKDTVCLNQRSPDQSLAKSQPIESKSSTWMSAMETAATRCILAARERQLMASSRGAHGCCSLCTEQRRGYQIRPNSRTNLSRNDTSLARVLTGSWRLERKRST